MIRFLFILFFFYSNLSFAEGIRINSVKVNCGESTECKYSEDIFSSLKRSYKNISHFKSVLKLYVSNEGVKSFYYELIQEDKRTILEIELEERKTIVKLDDVEVKGGSIELPTILPIREDDYYDVKRIDATKNLLRTIAKDQGYPSAKVKIDKKTEGSGYYLKFTIVLNRPILIKDISINTSSRFLESYVKKKINYNIGNSFNIKKLKSDMEDLRNVFVQFGYYLLNFEIKYKILPNREVKLLIDLKNTHKFIFYLKNDLPNKKEIKEYLKENLVATKRILVEDNIKSILREFYEKRGYKYPTSKVEMKKIVSRNKDKLYQYDIEIRPGKRSKLADLYFKGNSFFTSHYLQELYYEFASDQAKEDIYDLAFYKDFAALIKEKYVEVGFVSVFVGKPNLVFDVKNNTHTLSYKVREGIRTSVRNMTLSGLSSELDKILKRRMINKGGKPFNPIALKEDLKVISGYLKENGYYFSKIRNINSSKIVKYKNDNSEVDITLDIFVGKKIFVDNIIIIGNAKSRKTLIRRELDFRKGDLITSKVIESSQTNLLSLGLFSSVQIKPVNENLEKTDLIVFVKEKDFGVVEIAPGLRSDLGFKFSASVLYNNIDGLNKRVSLKASANRRFDLNSLDDERRQSGKELIEYDTSINYSENHIFDSNFDFSTSYSLLRKRFYSYDADITRLGYTVSRVHNRWLSFAFRQQIEVISQFEATDKETNEGHFQIGSLTPSMSLDFRDAKVNPRKGALFDFSVEFANPFFFSQQNEELTINYYKLVNRNKFYLPMGSHFVLAVSTAFGIQENKATDRNSDGDTEGYIPNIKVFRLSGADIVRGFEDEEINRLVSGKDISDVQVSNRAYMANLKVEPRYYLTDSSIFGVFYDAGRVFVNEFSQDDLRSSVGISFKYLTPVGSLDFDYGIKLLRKEDSDGNLESPGKVHVSIGFF